MGNCKHGIIKQTCAYCTGKITKPTHLDEPGCYPLRIIDYTDSYPHVCSALRKGCFTEWRNR